MGVSVRRRAMRENERISWRDVRSRGLTRYLLVTGLGKAGISFLAVFGSLDYVTRYGFGDASVSHVASRFLLWVPGAVVVGLLFAIVLWLVMNQAYHKSQDPSPRS